MSANKVVPAKLPSNQFDHFYRGGDRIGALRHGLSGPMCPEEWISSVTTRFSEAEQGLSKLPDGRFLKDAIGLVLDGTGEISFANATGMQIITIDEGDT